MSNNNTKKSIADLLKPKKKYVYPCHCVLCKGAEVDPRTQEKHTRDNILWRSDDYDSRRNQMNAIAGRKQNKPNIILSVEKNLVGASSIKKRKRDDNQQISPIENSADSSIPNSFLSPIMSSSLATPKNPQPDTTTLDNMVNDASKPKTSYFHDPESNNENNNEYDNNNIWEMEYDVNDIYNINQEEESSPKNNSDNDDEEYHIYNIDQEGEGLFASPIIDSDKKVFELGNLDDSINTEIILWAFKFQQRYRLSDIALEALIKFLHILLIRINKSQFEGFPTSIYKEEGNFAVMNCLHEEFADNLILKRRNKCNNPLSALKKNKNGIIAVPRMLYPKLSIRQQLSMLYQRPGFEDMLQLSGAQKNSNSNIYSDIYDGRVWKTFPFDDGSSFFTTETAVTHLGLLFNLDWFQPFTYTQHSTGALYASICNLPRSERNKPENIIYLGFLPGPKEVGLERINHYLAPIVDEFLELWKGWRVPKTHRCPDGLDIKVALIVGSSDIPATRKLFGHGSAAMKCNRCEKRSTYSREYKKTHYGGMQDYNKWVTRPANPLLHRQYAHKWLRCFSKASREAHFKEHGVRWSELLRLPYMDPIRFAVVDPMYCLFLDVAKWIIKSIFINQNKLNMEQLHIAQNRMDHVDLPPDIGRIPPKIAIGNDGFSNLTADQWKTFIMIYSTTILWDMLDDNDRKILGHFVRACNLLVARFITEDDLKEAQEKLKDMAYLIENTYGPEFITSNIHLALHIPDCCCDYDYHLSRRWSSGLLDESLYLLMPKKAHARLQIGAEIFGSMIVGRHENNATILAKWRANNDESTDIYPGEAQYYFEHTIRFPEGSRTHLLAYVKWYKPATTSATRFKHNFMESEVSNTELWKAEYFQKGSDSLLAVYRILCKAVKLKYVMKRPNQQNQQKYFSIVPLNRRFNL
ncbi:hypothetical protein GLOIN_2v1474510 [Rhizophagus irregularis DAOM 181602=DAOM 197198]|nr:hypothetical protein GLOIN_2v1474510 [Rhizophagus irregularis DAOM 181602=DAOM 197198]